MEQPGQWSHSLSLTQPGCLSVSETKQTRLVFLHWPVSPLYQLQVLVCCGYTRHTVASSEAFLPNSIQLGRERRSRRQLSKPGCERLACTLAVTWPR